MKGIADTGFLVAFVARDDTHHDWATDIAAQAAAPFLTCEAVLAETAFHLGDASMVLGLVDSGLVELSFDCRENVPRLAALARKYADRRPDLADICLIRMSELHPRHFVVTTDRGDFGVYRRNQREAIPLIFPPG